MIKYIFIIVLLVCSIGESAVFFIYKKIRKSRIKKTVKALYKLLETRVLNMTLTNNITKEEAAVYEYRSSFLRFELLDGKPWCAYIFPLDDVITIGRSRDNRISISDDNVSRVHCKIYVNDGLLYLSDLGTSNRTIIKRGLFKKYIVGKHESVELREKDVIKIGSFRLRIALYMGYEAVR